MDLQEQKINIRGIDINYLETGKGEHPILLLSGTLGTLWLHFGPQIEKLDRNRFTIVAWDPPGYGKSRPPDRKFSEDFLETDAALANDLMQALGHKTFSTIGFCGGGKTALALAAIYPDSIRKNIIIGTNTYLLPEETIFYESLKDIHKWPAHVLEESVTVYGYDYFKSAWSSWIDGLLNLSKKQNGDICSNLLEKIQCQTLIVMGTEDRLTNESHAVFLNTKIRHSRVHIFEKGLHRPHMKFPNEFNDLARNFLSSSSLHEFDKLKGLQIADMG